MGARNPCSAMMIDREPHLCSREVGTLVTFTSVDVEDDTWLFVSEGLPCRVGCAAPARRREARLSQSGGCKTPCAYRCHRDPVGQYRRDVGRSGFVGHYRERCRPAAFEPLYFNDLSCGRSGIEQHPDHLAVAHRLSISFIDVGRPRPHPFGAAIFVPRLDLKALFRQPDDPRQQLDLGSQRCMQVV